MASVVFSHRHCAKHAGIVDQDVDGAEMPDHLGHHAFDIGDFRAIGLDRFGVAAGGSDPLRNRIRGGIIAVINYGDRAPSAP